MQAAGGTQAAPLGLIAGAGSFPFLVAEGARREGRRVVIVGLRGFAEPGLRDLADAFYWSGVVRLGGWKRIFAREGVREAIMAGRVRKSDMYGRLRLPAVPARLDEPEGLVPQGPRQAERQHPAGGRRRTGSRRSTTHRLDTILPPEPSPSPAC